MKRLWLFLLIASTTFAQIPNGSVQNYSTSTGARWQQKAIYDMRDYLKQDGVTDDTIALTKLLNSIGANPATLMFTGITKLESVNFPTNIELDFTQSGGISPITSTTPLGGAGFVQGSGSTNSTVLTTSCSVTLSGTTPGNAILFMENHINVGGLLINAPTDGADNYTNLIQQSYNYTSVNSSWVASNIAGGNRTITINYPTNNGAVANSCIAWEISGMGPVVGLDSGIADVERNPGSINMFSPGSQVAGPLTTTAGAFLAGYGGQTFLTVTCTAGATYTQPASTAGQVGGGSQPSTGYGTQFCAEYRLSSPGGSQVITQALSADPYTNGGSSVNRYWAYSAISLVPSSARVTVKGPILAPARQIFYNSFAGQGTIDLTGNTQIDKVFPEWWGASAASSANTTTNTSALQAAIVGAFGSNRINGTLLNRYNRELHLSGIYGINGTLNADHMNGFKWTCSVRLACGISQGATNASILTTTTGGTYGSFENILWTTSVAQDLAHPLVDLNYTASLGNDLVTQFIDFPGNIFVGNFLANVGIRIAGAGGGAQGSNITFYNNSASTFLEAAYMVGSGSACVPITLATNAVSIEWFNGDMQFNNAFAIEWFGGGMLKVDGTTFENGFGASTNVGVQTGYDICGDNTPTGQSFQVENSRSESLFFLAGGPYNVTNSFNTDRAFVLAPGATPGVNTTMQGTTVAGHGAYQNVTVAGTWTGIATPGAPILASSGTGTTLINTNQTVAGANTIGHFVKLETVTQAVTGSTGTLLNVPISVGTVTGSVTSGTIGASHVMTQATTGVTCNSVNAPAGTQNLQLDFCSGTADNSHIWTDGTTSGTYTPSAAPAFGAASPTMIITAATGAPDNSHNWVGGTSSAVLVPTAAPANTSALSVNAWVGWYLTLIGGTGGNQYCVITANGTQDFTCGAGWVTDFPDYVTIANPDNTTTYVVEPQWGVQTTNGSVTWAAITKKVGTFANASNVFIPGLQVNVGNRPVLRNFQVTRPDWNGTVGFFADSTFIYNGMNGVLAGPTAAPGTGIGGLLTGPFYRQKFLRNGITETGYPIQDLKGTSIDHWQAGQTGGGISYVDIYAGADNNFTAGTKKGRYFIENNSSGTPRFWYMNTDGTMTAPGVISAPSFISTSNAWTAGTIAAIGDVICPSAPTTASDCATSALNFIGIAPGTSGTIFPQTSGFATLNYDGTVSPSAGWFACMSAITVGKVLAQAAACPGGQAQIGILAAGGTNVTSGSVWLTILGGGSGGTTGITNVATTTPISGGPITATGTISCPTCATGPGTSVAGHLAVFTGTNGLTLSDGGAVPGGSGTVTNTAGALTLNAAVLGNGGADIKTGVLPGAATDGSFPNMAVLMATPALSVVNPLLVQVQTFDIIKAAAVGTNSQQLIFGACYTGTSPTAPAADGARQVACSSSANVVIARFQAGSAAFINNVVQAQSQTAAGTSWKLFSGRAGVNSDGTLGAGAEVFSVNGQGDIAARALVLSTLTPGTSPICPNGAGGALTTTGCTGGGGGGTGTVTHTLGNLTANAIMLGNGVADSKVLPAINTNGNGEIDLGLNGSVSGGLKLLGSTSGSAIITAAPAAGTPNAIYLPLATGPVNGVLTTNGANPQQTTFTTSLAGLASVTSTAVNSSGGALNGTLGATTPATVAATTLVAQGATVSGPPGIATGTASNTDLAGQLTLSTGTITYTFVGTYISAPICVATDVTAKNAVQVSATTTVLTINGTSSDVVNYICVGRN